MSELLERLRRASRKSPRELADRVVEIGRGVLQRPWSRVYPHLVTERALLRMAGASSIDELWRAQQRSPFFLTAGDGAAYARVFRTRYPEVVDHLVAAADRVLRHEFDLLGSGCVPLGPALPWHTDFKTGRTWPIEYAARLEYAELDQPTDVKVPWELSRSQHFTTLGQAYWLTGKNRYAQEFAHEVSDWIARNPWGYGVNWACAMDVALRALNWIWGFHFFAASSPCSSREFRAAFLRALYLHGEYVATHLERGDVNGNHFLSDAVGLIALGGFFRPISRAGGWLALGRGILDVELAAQTGDDGVDYEQSTAYHRLVLELFLTGHLLAARHGTPFSADWVSRLERMFEFVEAYVKPDGSMPLVGDADDGRVQKLGVQAINDHRYLLSIGAVLFSRPDFKRAAGSFRDEAFWLLGPSAAARFDALAAPPAPTVSRAFDSGGFYVLRTDRAHVFIDCAEVGMRGRGGHGHSDITSIEVWLDGLNLVSDCGAYLYTASREWRNRFRSTAFHNVVQVDGEELNRMISPDHLWQLRDDAHPRDVAWQWSDRADYFRGAHDGYARLDPPVRVSREVLLVKDGPDVLVRDSIDGRGSRELVWRFHLSPSVGAEIHGADVRLRVGERDAWLQLASHTSGLTMTIEEGWVSPSYGVRTAIGVVTLRGRVALPQVVSFRLGLVALPFDRLRAAVPLFPAAAPVALVGAAGG
jgi:heparinase II/III-like protein